MSKNPAAVALGKLARGKAKHYSKEELAKRTARIISARKEHINKQRNNKQ